MSESQVIIDGSVPRSPLDRIETLAAHALDGRTGSLPTQVGELVDEARGELNERTASAEIEDEMMEQLSELETFGAGMILIHGRDPGDILAVPESELGAWD